MTEVHKAKGLERVGRASARRPYVVLAIWIAIIVIAAVGKMNFGGTYQDNLNLSGTQAYTGSQLLSNSDRSASGYSGLIVIHAYHGTIITQQSAVQKSYTELTALPDVISVSDPLAPGSPTLSTNQQTAYFNVAFSVLPKSLGTSYLTKLESATSAMRSAGLEVEYGGQLDQLTRPPANDVTSEEIGFAVALIVLLLSFGSILGAFMPLITAVFSVLTALSILAIVASVITFGTSSPTLALMIGLGVGIDYAVFLTTRFRQKIKDGIDPVTAAGKTVSTSGHAVLVAASSVSIALIGLYVSGVSFIGKLGLAAVFGVVTAAAGAITLVPAGLSIAGRRIDSFHVRVPVAESSGERDRWHLYAESVGRRPWLYLLGGLILLGTLSIPLFSIQIGHVGDGADPLSYTDKRAYDLISKNFGPGLNGTFTVVVDLAGNKTTTNGLAQTLYKDLSAVNDVAQVSKPTTTKNGQLLISTVVPKTGPQNSATTTLFNNMIDTSLPNAIRGTGTKAYVTGATASQIQFSQILASRLPITILAVVLTAFLLIASSFRSLLLAIKAALMNLLSIGAAYGIVVAMFQWGWGRSLIGVSENVPIESYVPIIMFAIVFGLSMDYEIFLLSRVKEGWDRTRDNRYAVASGLSATARVITAAALIMVSVFTAFVGSTNVVIKMLAVGLASSVLIDATIVRLLLVPAIMNILGAKSWWMPKWLDKILPRIEPEGFEPSEEADETEELVSQ